VFCRSHLSWIHWLKGEPERARASIDEAMAHSERLAQPASRGFAAHFAATLACMMGDVPLALQHADELNRLSSEQGMPHWEACARIDRGWAVSMSGHAAEGAGSIREGIGALMATGSQVAMTQYLWALASALLAAGAVDDAARVIEDAHAFIAVSDEHFLEPTIVALEAEAMVRRGDAERGASRLSEAVKLAESQGSMGLAAMLARRLR
jgi:predicted ATPase